MIPAMLLLFVGATSAWYAFTDPPEGFIAAVGNLIQGKPATAESASVRRTNKQTATLSAVFAGSDTSAGGGSAGGGSSAGGGENRTGTEPWGIYKDPPASDTSAGGSSAVVKYARTFLGTPYVYGGHTRNGFDCAGFTHYVALHFGVNLAWYVGGQLGNRAAFSAVAAKDRKPGDWVFYGVHHVAIYVGNNTVIHSPKPGTVNRLEGNLGNTPGPIVYRRLKAANKGTGA